MYIYLKALDPWFASAPVVAMPKDSLAHAAMRAPPGLSASDGESSTASRERRRVALAAREVTAALLYEFPIRFEALEAKMDRLISQVAGVPALKQDHDVNVESRIDRLEALLMVSPILCPSVDQVLTELLARKNFATAPESEVSAASTALKFDIVDSEDGKLVESEEEQNADLERENEPAKLNAEFDCEIEKQKGEPKEFAKQNVDPEGEHNKQNGDMEGKSELEKESNELDGENELEEQNRERGANPEKQNDEPEKQNTRFGYSLGEAVGWVSSDADVPPGSHGEIVEFRKEDIAVKFSFGEYLFPPEVLYRVGVVSHGFKFGSSVAWSSQESYVTDVPRGTRGVVTRVQGEKIIVNFGIRQLLLDAADLRTVLCEMHKQSEA